MPTYKIAKSISDALGVNFNEDVELSDELLNIRPMDHIPIKPWNTGLKHSEETKKLIGLSKLGKPRIGIPHSEKSKMKMRAAHLGKTLSPETRAKMSAVRKGKHQSPETRAKLSLSHQGRKHSPETCRKISETRKKLFRNDI